MGIPRGPRARVLRLLGSVLLAVVLALYLGLPFAMAVAVVWPARAPVGEPPPGFREVTFETAEGAKLAAWYTPPRNGSAVILAHGAGGSRESVRPLAVMLARHGYGVLSVDLRGHGRSEGGVNRLGWRGTSDVRAAVEYLAERPEVRSIGGVGSSMGGEVLLGASDACPDMRAIVADGATRRCTAELMALASERPLVRNFTARVMYGAVRLLSGERPPVPLLDEMQRSRSTSFLLVAAGEDSLEVSFNRLFERALGERATLWVVPGVEHTAAWSRHLDEYERRVIGFLDRELLSENGVPEAAAER